MKESPKFGEEKHPLCALRLSQAVSSIQSADHSYLPHKIKIFISFVDQAPLNLRQNFLDLPELQGMWNTLLESHSTIILGWKLSALPKFSPFNQLIGLYRYFLASTIDNENLKLDLLLQATEQGSINAMITLGDTYIDKIIKKEKVDLNEIVKKVASFSTLFFTPGHIIAADIYLAAWSLTTSIDSYFKKAIYHLCMAEILQKRSTEYNHNAYGTSDFMAASKAGMVFRSEEYKGQNIGENIASNLAELTKYTTQKLDLKPIMQLAFNEAATPEMNIEIKSSHHKVKPPACLEKFFIDKLKKEAPSDVIDYLISKPLPGFTFINSYVDKDKDTLEPSTKKQSPGV